MSTLDGYVVSCLLPGEILQRKTHSENWTFNNTKRRNKKHDKSNNNSNIYFSQRLGQQKSCETCSLQGMLRWAIFHATCVATKLQDKLQKRLPSQSNSAFNRTFFNCAHHRGDHSSFDFIPAVHIWPYMTYHIVIVISEVKCFSLLGLKGHRDSSTGIQREFHTPGVSRKEISSMVD